MTEPHRIFFVLDAADKGQARGPVASRDIAERRAAATDGVLVEIPTQAGLDDAAYWRAIEESDDA